MSSAQTSVEIAEQFESIEQQRRADLAGMWVFLGTEMLFFGGMFAAFYIYRFEEPAIFAAAAGKMDLVLGTINTAILLTSSLFMSLADPAMEGRRRGTALAMITIALLLGLGFLSIKGYEYNKEVHEHLAPILGMTFHYDGPQPVPAQKFFVFDFALTGLHAVHMTIGVGALVVALVSVWRWRDPARLERQVRITGLYWAFVDVMWIFIYPTLYLLRS